MPEFKTFVLRLLPVRPEMPSDPTQQEAEAMARHFQYLKKLTAEGKVLLAGPVFGNPVYGLGVLRVSDEAEARDIASHDPSVLAGVNTVDVEPLSLALMAYNVPRFRYPDDVSDRVLKKEITVRASLDDTWSAWTTTEGLKSFFSPNSRIELRIGGPFEIQFNMSAPYGSRGSEDCYILSYVPKRMLSFEWNAPPQFGEIRYVHHFVVLEFEPVGGDSVKVTLSDLGWGTGESWDKLYAYFDEAWSRVLESFKESLEVRSRNISQE